MPHRGAVGGRGLQVRKGATPAQIWRMRMQARGVRTRGEPILQADKFTAMKSQVLTDSKSGESSPEGRDSLMDTK